MSELSNKDVPCVLIVEDEPKSRRLLAQWMPEMGFSALEAGSAEQALLLVREQQVDIAIIDLNLPGLDGMSFFEKLRALDKTIPVIIVTGYGQLEAAQRAIDLDVVAFLSKPSPLGEIEAALARAVARLRSGGAIGPNVDRSLFEDEAEQGGVGNCNKSPEPPTLAELERQAILEALERHNWNRAATAAELGISVRTLYYRLQQYSE